ncbi:MAG: transglutaminase domain-containing protein [Bacteroidales bacterium]|nr:transglutaminase domain-containing protein [Candidatus Colicola faecequi]
MNRLLIIFLLALLAIVPVRAQVATVLTSTTEVESFSERSAVCRYRQSVIVRSSKGTDAAEFVSVCSPYCELSKFSGKVTDLFGREIRKIKKADLTRSEYSSSLADDYYFWFFEYEPVSYPVVVTYEWEEKLSGSIIAYPPFAPQSSYEVDVVGATYRFISHSADSLRWQARNATPSLTRTEEKGRTVYEFSFGSLPALPRYAWGLPLREQAPSVQIAPQGFDMQQTRCDLRSWQSLGLWSAQLISGRDVLPEALRTHLHQLTDTCTTARQKVLAVRKYMGETTRYVSIQLGIGGWQPMSAADVYAKGIGDCKALSNYLRAMLREVGIESVYTLISTRERRLLPDFPTMNQLDHVVLMVPLPGDTMWIECTNPRIPAGYAPSGWAGHEAILVTPEGGRLIEVPGLPDSLCRELASYDIVLDASGNARVSGSCTSTGRCFEQDARFERLDSDDRRKSLLRSVRLPKATILSLDARTEGSVFGMQFEAETEGYARVSGSRMFIPVSPYSFPSLSNAKEPAHTIDLSDEGYTHTDTVRFTIPEGWRIESLPRTRDEHTPFGNCELNITAGGRQITVVVSSSLISGRYPQADYDAWIAFRKSRTNLTKQEIVLVRI